MLLRYRRPGLLAGSGFVVVHWDREKKGVGGLAFCFVLAYMIPHSCLDTLSHVRRSAWVGYSGSRIHWVGETHIFDSESAFTPSLGRRVGTETVGGDNAATLSLCRSRGRWFCFCLVLSVLDT